MSPYEEQSELTRWLTVAAGVVVLLKLLGVLLGMGAIGEIQAQLAPLADGSLKFPDFLLKVEHATSLYSKVGSLSFLAFVVSAILFLIWQYRAMRNDAALEGSVQTDQIKAVAVWFVPFANLLLPFKVVQEIWESSRKLAHIRRPSNLLTAWWAASVIGFLVSWFAANRMNALMSAEAAGTPAEFAESVGRMLSYGRWEAFGGIAVAASAGLLVQIVRKINEMQEIACQEYDETDGDGYDYDGIHFADTGEDDDD